uniref:EF-hand domain-containing protein n=1 Tax=Pavo cristatus TaxID=9049 RepID=A0A8C9FRS5_PAVCR
TFLQYPCEYKQFHSRHLNSMKLDIQDSSFSYVEDGFIDFLEFIAAINLVIRGKIDQKLKWYFKLYDADGNGCIDKKELLSIFAAIQAINGQTNMTAEEFTNMIFQKIDVNNDGELTLEEFITGVERDEDLMELITKSFDLSNVIKVIQNGREHDVVKTSPDSTDPPALRKILPRNFHS